MEPKKNPKIDIHKKRSLIFNFSLALSLFVVVCAFKVAVKVQEDGCVLPPVSLESYNEMLPPVPITSYQARSVEPIVKQKTLLAFVGEIKPVSNSTQLSEDAPKFVIDQTMAPDPGPSEIVIDVPIETHGDPFIIVERMPEPEGGLQAFFRTIGKEIKYPGAARRQGIEGKVFVEFVVNENGELTNFNVVRGIGAGCDEEAVRVLKLTKWSAGRQRGVPVKVRMMQQVTFQLAK